MFGNADDDDLDFNPAAGSKLASLFGLERSPEKGNPSLTYTAPKQPKLHHLTDDSSMSPKKSGSTNNSSTSATNKLSLILMKVVASFKLEDGSYKSQGNLGLALLGSPSMKLFQLYLYKGKQTKITSVRITSHFQFTVQQHLYATFYDDQTQNWSVKFDSKDDAMEFTAQVAVARYRSASEEGIVYQEIFPGVGDKCKEGENVKLKLKAQPFTVDTLHPVNLQQSMIECTLDHKVVNSGWAAGIVGAGHNSICVILVPLIFQIPWLTSKRSEPLFIEAHVIKDKFDDADSLKDQMSSGLKTNPSGALASGAESAVDSSADDASVRARGASIKEALSNSPRSNKASIISRMARMGQATLPLKGAIVCNPSDSDQETEEDSVTTGSAKTSVKTRPLKTRSVSSSSRQQPTSSPTSQSLPVTGVVAPVTMTVVQSPTHWNQHQQNIMRTNTDNSVVQIMTSEGQLVSLSSQQQLPLVSTSNTVMSPVDQTPQMSMFLSEARLQNTEMRMHLTKVCDKMDQLLTKVDNMHVSPGPSGNSATSGIGLEPNVLLSSIQKLVQDNQSLQAEVSEKNKRLDEQNERIFSLLNTNSKFLEQSSSLLEQKQLQEQHQLKQEQQQMEQQQQLQLIQQMREEKASLGNQLGSLQNQLATLQELVQALQKSNNELNQELQINRRQLQEKEKCILEMDQARQATGAENRDLQLSQALDKEREKTNQLQEQILITQTELDSTNRSANDNLRTMEKQYKDEVSLLKTELAEQSKIHEKMIINLEADCEGLRKKLQEKPNQVEPHPAASLSKLITDVKLFMNTLHKGLNHQFNPIETYEGAQIRALISSVVKREALHFVGKLEESNPPFDLKDAVPVKETSSLEPLDPSVAASNHTVENLSCGSLPPDVNHVSIPHSVVTSPSEGLTGTENLKASAENVNTSDLRKDVEFEGSWRPQPPPPPLFQDDDDSDDWLT